MSFGEAASVVPCEPFDSMEMANWFKGFYNGFTPESIIWFAYEDDPRTFEFPSNFNFEEVSFDEEFSKSFKEIISPGILPVDFVPSRFHNPSYKFYYPSVAARQLGFGQLPLKAFFSDIIKSRDMIGSSTEYNRLKNLKPNAGTLDFSSWAVHHFTTESFRTWWEEWKEHIFSLSATTYC